MQTLFSNDWKSRLIVASVFALGVSAVVAQLALLREFLAAFSGNELTLGVALGNWMLLTGLGAWLGRFWAGPSRDPTAVLIVALILAAVLPPVEIFSLRVLRDLVFIRGAIASVEQTVATSFVLLLPFCVASGFLLAIACAALAPRDGEAAVGRVYLSDSLGSIAGGLIFSFVLIRFFDHFAIVCFPALLSLVFAVVLASVCRKKILLGFAAAFAIGIAALLAFGKVDEFSTALQFPGQRVVFRGNSPYGRLVVTESSGQLNFIENGVPVVSTHNAPQVEEAVHYAMAQRPDARKVLLISGGISGTAKEILKYGAAEVTCIELDPLIISEGRKLLPGNLADPRVKLVNTDGRLFVKQTSKKFDVIIVDVPEPGTSQINRFFTEEFFAESKRALNAGGVISISPGQYASYIGPQLARVLASARATALTQFRNVLMIPGGRIFFIASDGELFSDIAARLEQRKISTQWVRRSYLDAMMTPDRFADLQRAVAQPAEVNRDLNPVLYFYHLLYWASQFNTRAGIFEIVLAAAFAFYFLRLRSAPMAIFVSGFAASSLEVVLLLAFQIFCGSLYHQVGIIVTTFMAGLAIGAFMTNRPTARASRARLAMLAFGIAIFSALLPAVLHGLQHTGSLLVTKLSVSGLTLVLAILVGMEFPMAARIQGGGADVASRLYTADFLGAFLGALLPSVLLIPVFGVSAVCYLACGLNVVGGWFVARSAR